MWCFLKPDPDHPQSFPEWQFSNGTIVHAHSFDSAIQFLRSTKWGGKFWATETENGHWDVQFDEFVSVCNIKAKNMSEASQKARQNIMLDASTPRIRMPVVFE
jgi:hypothetical protein